MLKRILIGLGLTVVVLLGAAFLFRAEIVGALIASRLAPDHDFSADMAPAAPDYARPGAWAARPGKESPADDHPAGTSLRNLGVAVFFVHPTTYLNPAGWNQPLDDGRANWIVDERVLRHQASVFNGCCAVYAPRYRQATIYSFMDESGNGTAALDLAYQDIERAFVAFLDEIDERPFILAGHSQGSLHGNRLLREHIAGTALEERLVAAYLIGFSVAKDGTGGVPVCDHATAIGCVIGWNAVEGEGAGLFPGTRALVCTNPLTWEDDGGYAGHDLNRGAMGYPRFDQAGEGEDVTSMVLAGGLADAQCRAGNLSVPELRSDAFPSRMNGGSMHVYDYGLFYANLRDNAVQRVESYLSRRGSGSADA